MGTDSREMVMWGLACALFSIFVFGVATLQYYRYKSFIYVHVYNNHFHSFIVHSTKFIDRDPNYNF